MSQVVLADIRCVATGATVPSGVQTVILGPINLYTYKDKSFTLWNYSPVTLSGAVVQVNPDVQGSEFGYPLSSTGGTAPGPNPGLWENYDLTTFQSLGSGKIKSLQVTANTYKWWRVVGVSNDVANTQITISGWCYARSI